MKKYSFILFFLCIAPKLFAYNEKLSLLLQAQIKAFNTQNINQMVDSVSDDFVFYYISKDKLMLETKGKPAFRKSMQAYFQADFKPFSTIESYIIDGQRISFKEVVEYKNSQGKIVKASAMGIYQYEKDKIIRAWYFVD